MMKTIVTDLGGVIYSFDPDFDAEKHSGKFAEVVQWYDTRVLGFTGALEAYRGGKIDRSLDIELLAVTKALQTKNSGAPDELPVYFNQQAIQVLIGNMRSMKVVAIATSRKQTSRLILEKALGPDLSGQIDIYDMSEFGSKKDPEAWEKIFKHLGGVDVIIEDGEKNLEAAYQAALWLDYIPVKSTTMISL
ncbi:MAG: hypothetical protein A2Z96_03720 [Spirochaetes bacterium GWB1_48_6]|nr:MAG: hypothetical protein A2Z96_03720 [Spirochaetes bacterium GWB1_48_6]